MKGRDVTHPNSYLMSQRNVVTDILHTEWIKSKSSGLWSRVSWFVVGHTNVSEDNTSAIFGIKWIPQHFFTYETGRRKILNQIIAITLKILSELNLFVNATLNCNNPRLKHGLYLQFWNDSFITRPVLWREHKHETTTAVCKVRGLEAVRHCYAGGGDDLIQVAVVGVT
jgi:hypothetical protein